MLCPPDIGIQLLESDTSELDMHQTFKHLYFLVVDLETYRVRLLQSTLYNNAKSKVLFFFQDRSRMYV